MSRISGIRNLRDLYTTKYQEKDSQPLYGQGVNNKNRIKLP